MTYLEILSWARKGLAAEKSDLTQMLSQVAQKGCESALVEKLQEKVDNLTDKELVLDRIEELHNMK